MGVAACPVPLSPLSGLDLGLAPLAVLSAGGLDGARPQEPWGLQLRWRFAPVSARPKLQKELCWKEQREGQEGSFAEMLLDRHSVETAAAGCRRNEIHKY